MATLTSYLLVQIEVFLLWEEMLVHSKMESNGYNLGTEDYNYHYGTNVVTLISNNR